ncbi:uncharacterized protein L201_002380 [Kwoniella dendrophila CBS 6074]|uniref:Zn(2)-C6 fungal-type domain-containing protein n=1 Tax=Kwoniella dendrophila CBS 6074 TaxID=1295534 RepID=A0AAX4JQ06_9TREE
MDPALLQSSPSQGQGQQQQQSSPQQHVSPSNTNMNDVKPNITANSPSQRKESTSPSTATSLANPSNTNNNSIIPNNQMQNSSNDLSSSMNSINGGNENNINGSISNNGGGNGGQHSQNDLMDQDMNDGSLESAKRPRLRLAHACDRCRRRKIRCDTQHPCTPCQQSNNQCTFETPSRRTVKQPKNSKENKEQKDSSTSSTSNNLGGGGGGSGGVKRPHSPLRATLASLTSGQNGVGGGDGSTNLEARLAALESMLRDVPPNVHNAFLSTLDARLGSGTGIGLKEGNTIDGVSVAVEALKSTNNNKNSSVNTNNLNLNSLLGIASSSSNSNNNSGPTNYNGSDFLADLNWNMPSSSSSTNNFSLNNNGPNSTLLADWTNNNNNNTSTSTSSNNNNSNGSALSNWLAGIGVGPGLTKRREEVGMDELAKRMEGMSFFYEDEIGQAKWQGATSGFPLLHLLTAANAQKETGEENPLDILPDVLASPVNSTLSISPANAPSIPRRVSSPATGSQVRSASVPAKGRSSSMGIGSGGSGRTASPMGRGAGSRPRKERFFPDRTPRPHQTLNPEASWKVITGVIPPDLMDTLVRCYLSTSHLLWPFLHVPSFLADYANPQQWGEPGFTCFIVAVCTLSSRHVDDPRVRANSNDPSTAGKQYFELFKRLRDLPSADRPTLYSIQAAFLAAIYAFGLGNLSKAFALQAESITLCLDGGLHRSVDGYDHFDAVEKETRKRTFWSIYSWDKQSAALFGRPPIIHLRDCDVTEPLIVDDENLTAEGIKDESIDEQSRMCAFVAAIRLHVILEGVIDSATRPSSFPTSPFLAKAAATIARRSPQNESLQDELGLLEEWTRILPKYWHYDNDTAASRDPIRITQAERLHCLEHLVKMIIYRHRFSGFVAMPASTQEERARHIDLCRKAMQCALCIIADHVHISQRGMMTYYGVHVIHQLAQAGRTLVAVILNCRDSDFRPIVAPSIEGLRSCVGLLRRFSGRYLCGLRSADIIDEFCRICNIPVNSPRVPDSTSRPSPAWLRPVPKRFATHQSGSFNENSPGTMMDFPASTSSLPGPGQLPSSMQNDTNLSNDLDALFNTSAYFDMSAIEAGTTSSSSNTNHQHSNSNSYNDFSSAHINTSNNNNGLGEPSAPFDRFETITPNGNTTPTNGNIMLTGNHSHTPGPSLNHHHHNSMNSFDNNNNHQNNFNNFGSGNGNHNSNNNGNTNTNQISFDYGLNGMGYGGEALAGEGMDTVSDGLKGNNANGGLSAATILSLMEEGSFDYGSIFTDQAPLPMDVEHN